MKSHEFITEGPQSGDYQRMMDFVNTNKTPGVPPEQQIALAMFRELDKQKQQNSQLSAELKSAEQRIDLATQGGELAKTQLGKHQSELERERERGAKEKDAQNQIDQAQSDREKASEEQIQGLTARLETIKNKPGVNPEATKELENQIKQLQKNGVDIEKYKGLEQAVSSMQKMQQVDDRSMQSLIGQVKDAQAKADELAQTRTQVGSEIEQSSGVMQDEIDQLKQQLARFREVEQTVAALQPMVQDVIAPKVDKLVQKQDIADKLNNRRTAQAFARDEITRGMPNMVKPPTPAPNPQMSLPGVQPVAEDKLFKLIKWATGK
jgi:DNA repair exonuclease SbcCD ATPase subunit